jgi:hypothetical protein
MRQEDYPALFISADEASNSYQAFHLRLVKAEYATLFVAAVFSMSFLHGVAYFTIYAFVFVVGLAILLTRSLRRPEQDWYRCRALAESIKTLTWRYMMHAAPFNLGSHAARAEFRNHLHRMFSENRSTAEKIAHDWSANDQITTAMDEVHAQGRSARMAYYLDKRVNDQRRWYVKKAGKNRDDAKFWVVIGVMAYLLAAALALSRIALPNWQYWPIEPVIVLAASLVGWTQIKKFNELSAAYTVAAHEIGLIRPLADGVKNDDEFSEFINDSEKAFSREHTLWIARQSD